MSGWVGGTGGKEDEKVSERRRLKERERCVLERLDERESLSTREGSLRSVEGSRTEERRRCDGERKLTDSKDCVKSSGQGRKRIQRSCRRRCKNDRGGRGSTREIREREVSRISRWMGGTSRRRSLACGWRSGSVRRRWSIGVVSSGRILVVSNRGRSGSLSRNDARSRRGERRSMIGDDGERSVADHGACLIGRKRKIQIRKNVRKQCS